MVKVGDNALLKLAGAVWKVPGGSKSVKRKGSRLVRTIESEIEIKTESESESESVSESTPVAERLLRSRDCYDAGDSGVAYERLYNLLSEPEIAQRPLLQCGVGRTLAPTPPVEPSTSTRRPCI